MRLRRPAIAATTLGLAGALLPASGAAAAEPPDRHVLLREDVTYQSEFGHTGHCTVQARLEWVFGQEGSQDDVLKASTYIYPTPGYPEHDCANGEDFWMNAGVTLRWTYSGIRRYQTYTYSAEGNVFAEVSDSVYPYESGHGTEAESISSEHRADFTDCASNCEWSRTLTFNSK